MKRAYAFLLLTAAVAALRVASGQPSTVAPPLDVVIRRLTVLGPAPEGKLCARAPNLLRAEIVATGSGEGRTLPMRLVLVVPGGSAAGTVVAEGSVAARPGVVTSFTFLNVHVPSRLRGRGARLVARVNLDGGSAERDLAGNTRALWIDEVTDWSCTR